MSLLRSGVTDFQKPVPWVQYRACSMAFDMVYFGHRDCEASSHSVVSCAALAACDFLAGFALHEVSW